MLAQFSIKIKRLLKTETVLIIAAVAAIISMFFTPPSVKYFSYIDFRVLALLFSLMTVVVGLQKIGVFNLLSQKLLQGGKNIRILNFLLVMMTFFSAMFITNDVSLITFIPFTIMVLTYTNQTKYLIWTVTLQTIAANLGSMLTPFGNPQNLYLFSYYHIPIGKFFLTTGSITGLSLFILLIASLFIKGETVHVKFSKPAEITSKSQLVIYFVLFALCLACVFRIVNYAVTALIVAAVVFIIDKKLFRSVDYGLLLTFICFFIFVGNIGEIGAVKNAVSGFLSGKTIAASVLLSQMISNVPTAVLLSSFTGDWNGLLLGTNIGGLGTLIASLASLISYKLYLKAPCAKPGRYLLVFTISNIAMLGLLLLFTALI